jgi:methyl-accepting chemotaxis protein
MAMARRKDLTETQKTVVEIQDAFDEIRRLAEGIADKIERLVAGLDRQKLTARETEALSEMLRALREARAIRTH